MRKSGNRQRVTTYLARHPGASAKEIAAKLGISVSYVYRLLTDYSNKIRREAIHEVAEPEESPVSAQSVQVGGDHYLNMAVQPWDVISCWPVEQQLAFFRGNAIKYLMRMGAKDARVQEARKARHYVSKMIEVLEQGSEDAAPCE